MSVIQIYSGLSKLLVFGLIFFDISSCNFQAQEKKQFENDSSIVSGMSYDFMNPSTVYDLPNYLKEISGIAYFGESKIACIQDEEATIYIFDTEKGEVVSRINFGKNEDYEDIAIVKNDAFVLRSDGTLFKIKNFAAIPEKAIKIKTPLNQKNDTEGLFYDSISNSLLIACKDSPSIEKEKPFNGLKAIYGFDLKAQALNEDPIYLLDFSKNDKAKESGSVAEFFTEMAIKLKLSDGSSFFPSAIAIHPNDTNKIYMLSSIGKMLIIMNKQGKIIELVELDSRIFNQPEGISFSENGDLYISNEGINRGGNILKFKPICNSLKKN